MAQAEQNKVLLEIGDNLRKERVKAKKSQHELGLDIGATSNTVHRYEIGTVGMSIERLCQISDSLGVSPLKILPQKFLQETDERTISLREKWAVLSHARQEAAYMMINVMLEGLLRQQEQEQM